EGPDGECPVGNEVEEKIELNPRAEADLEIRGSEERSGSIGSLVPFAPFLQLDPSTRDRARVSRNGRPLGLNCMWVSRCRILLDHLGAEVEANRERREHEQAHSE